MDRYRREARGRRPDARESTESHEGMTISVLATDDRRISSYSCDLGGFRLYANSRRSIPRASASIGATEFLQRSSAFRQ